MTPPDSTRPYADQAGSDPDLQSGNDQKRVPSIRRLWLMRLAAMILIPAFFLGALELGLRVAGYGYSTSYFLHSRVEGQDFLIPNYKFSYRFFPPALARVPVLSRIPAEKPAGTYRIFVFGESAALGDPDPSYGMGRYLEELLEERYPATDFEVACVAMTAINSHVIVPIARECACLQGDLWVIYMGNNEMVGPFGAGTVFGAKAPRLGFVRTVLALKSTRMGQLLNALLSGPEDSSSVPAKWTGINMFKENQLRHDDPNRLRTYENFEGNLKDILKAGRKAGVPIILSTVGSNLKDCAPFDSLHRADLDASGKSEWDTLFQQGRDLETAEDYRGALIQYSNAAAIDSEYAELQFRIGHCQLALADPEEARPAFERARDYDALAVRADARINGILIDAARESGDRVVGIDAAATLARQSSDGIPGEELFYEHVHFTVEGNYRLARIVADQVTELLPATILKSQSEDWPDRETCHQRLALTVWDQKRLWQEAGGRIGVTPFTTQSSHSGNVDYINDRIQEITAQITRETPRKDRQLYEAALARRPEDTLLIGNYAQFLEGTGSRREAIVQAEKFRALLPDLSWTHYYVGALMAREGRIQEAAKCFEKALEIRDDFSQAREALKSIQRKQR